MGATWVSDGVTWQINFTWVSDVFYMVVTWDVTLIWCNTSRDSHNISICFYYTLSISSAEDKRIMYNPWLDWVWSGGGRGNSGDWWCGMTALVIDHVMDRLSNYSMISCLRGVHMKGRQEGISLKGHSFVVSVGLFTFFAKCARYIVLPYGTQIWINMVHMDITWISWLSHGYHVGVTWAVNGCYMTQIVNTYSYKVAANLEHEQ